MDPEEQFIVRISNFASLHTAVNTDSVRPDELKAWADLLQPQYRGRFSALDPTVIGSGSQAGAYLANTFGADFVKRLYVDQAPGLTREDRQQADWLARGTYPITLGLRPEEMERLKSDGFPIQVLPPQPEAPGYISAGFGLVVTPRNPPHPNAARLFANWILMKDGQTAWNRANKTVSPRTDVDNAWVPPYLVPDPRLSYLDNYAWDYVMTDYARALDTIKAVAGEK
jgi:iron(III) transport system substrate-binding protein